MGKPSRIQATLRGKGASEGAATAREPRCAWSTALACLLIVLAVLAAFAPALDARFVNWDDPEHIVYVESFRGLGTQQLAWMFTTSHMGPYQPLSWLSLAVDHELWGLSPGLEAPEARHFHATNLLLHALAALAFFAVALQLFALVAPGADARARTIAATLAALLFAIHPLRCESVAWVTERRDVLSGLFYAVALAAWLRSDPGQRERVRSRPAALLSVACALAAVALFFLSVEVPHGASLRWSRLGPAGLCASLAAWIACAVFTMRAIAFAGGERWFALSIQAFALALLSKGLTLVLPAVLFVLDAWPLARWKRGRLGVLALEKLPLFALLPIAATLAFWGQASLGNSGVNWESHTFTERLAQAGYGLWFYPSRTAWPVDLLPIYELPDVSSFDQLRFLAPALFVIALGLALFGLRRRAPAALAAWIAFAVAVFPVLGFAQSGPQLVADRYSYLSCMPFALLAAGAWLCWLDSGRTSRVAVHGAAIAVVASLGVFTFRQTRIWHDSQTLFSHVIAVNPASPTGYTQMATYRSYQAGLAASDDDRLRLLREANEFYSRAMRANPKPLAILILNYGTNLMLIGRAQEAVEMLRLYVAVRPDDPMGSTNLGASLDMIGLHAEALQHLQRAVESDPNYLVGWLQLAYAREGGGDLGGAIAAYEQVLRLRPDDARAREGLARIR